MKTSMTWTAIRHTALSLLIIFGLVISRQPLAAQAAAAQVKLAEGTQVRLKLMESLNSGAVQAGQTITFEVLDNVKVGETVVIAEGASAWGTIVEAEGGKRMGRSGKLTLQLDYVKAVDGTKIPLRANAVKEGQGKGVSTGVAVGVTALFFWPAAPLWLLRKGKSAEIPRGFHVPAFVDGDRLVAVRGGADVPASMTASAPAPTTSSAAAGAPVSASAAAVNAGYQSAAPMTFAHAGGAAEAVTINVVSDPAGAEIEVDGAYYGNTPGLLKLPAGQHSVTVRQANGLVWQRVIVAAPGSSLTVKAEFVRGLQAAQRRSDR